MRGIRLAGLLPVLLLLLSCSLPGLPFGRRAAPTPTPAVTSAPAATRAPATTAAPNASDATRDQPLVLSGSVTYSNDFVFTYYVENAVALIDMRGFVARDEEYEIPVDGQTLGTFTLNNDGTSADYRLRLPALPGAPLSDVDNDGSDETGVQIFAVGWWPNLLGGPFSEGDDRSTGWPSYMASTRNDTEDNEEVIGGRLVVWAPDGQQEFPTGFGADKKLFTNDDPAGPLAAGYTVIDLDAEPFARIRDQDARLPLYEPVDAAIKDYSALSYTEAFAQLIDKVEREYAFNGIDGKQPDYAALRNTLGPRVAQAEADRNAEAFGAVLRDVALAFRDGHVNASGTPPDPRTRGGYGFAVRELDDRRLLVTYVLPEGPAAQAGVVPGDELVAVNGQPARDALAATPIFSESISSDIGRRLEQARLLLRGAIDTRQTFTIARAGQQRDIALTAIGERASYFATLPYVDYDPDALPVEFRTLDSGAGYIQINSNSDDLNLLLRLFDRALRTFETNNAPGVIIDLRVNFGGAPLGLATYLTQTEYELGTDEYYSEKTGQFEPDTLPDIVEPLERTYQFDQIVILTDQGCFSACEYEAYAFSLLPNATVVGQYPTAGVYAEVARGQFSLPEGYSMQVPTGRTRKPDGTILLEGVGVVPTVRVPVDAQTALADGDVVLAAAERLFGGQ